MALRVLTYLHKTAEMKMALGQPTDIPEQQHKPTASSSNSSSNQQAGGFFGGLKLVGYSDASFAPFGDSETSLTARPW